MIILDEDCFAIKKRRGRLPSGIYDVRLWNTSRVIPVYCDFDTDKGGWTVVLYLFLLNRYIFITLFFFLSIAFHKRDAFTVISFVC
jgi:hypothetical protein